MNVPGDEWNDAVPMFQTPTAARDACRGRSAATVYERWDDLAAVLATVPDERPSDPTYVPTPFTAQFETDIRDRLAPFRRYARDRRRLMQAVRWLWDVHRSAVVVAIRGGTQLWFLPYVNPGYVNTWRHADVDAELRRYCAAHRPADAPEWQSDVRRWWSNGRMLCSGSPPGRPLCRDRGFAAWLDMLRCAMARHTVPDVTFVLNRRDTPMLVQGWRDGRPHCNPFGDARSVSRPPPWALPVFSSFVRYGVHDDDVGVPEPSQWSVARGTHFPQCHGSPPPVPLKRCVVPLSDRLQRAVFRGSITSAARWHLVTAPSATPFVDARATATNSRRLKVGHTPTGTLAIEAPVRDVPPHGASRRHWMSLADQFATFVGHVVVDGHAAADREFHVLRSSGGVVFKLAPDDTHGFWYTPLLGLRTQNSPVLTCRTVPELDATVRAVVQDDPKLATGFAAAAAMWSGRYLTLDAMMDYVGFVLGAAAAAVVA